MMSPQGVGEGTTHAESASWWDGVRIALLEGSSPADSVNYFCGMYLPRYHGSQTEKQVGGTNAVNSMAGVLDGTGNSDSH
jgi:hypothetical protein